jgi:hypothetical protein
MPVIEEAINKQKKNTTTIVVSSADGNKSALSMCFALNTNTGRYGFFPFLHNISNDVLEWVNTKCEEIIKMLLDNKVEPFKYTDENEVMSFVANEMKCSLNGELDMFYDLSK